MKQCPQCQKIYADDMIYCLDDGSTLFFNSFSNNEEIPTVISSKQRINPQPSVNQNAKWMYPLIGVMSGLIIVFAFLAALPYLTAKKEGILDTTSPSKNEKVTTSQRESIPSPTVQTIIVEKEVPKSVSVPQPSAPPSEKQVNYPVVTVNSPRDGYLALKSEPCVAPCGTMLLKIPHGTRLSLGTCKDNLEVADRRRGRWCYTSYGGYTGWIFDAFVTR
jgi:hypothetical protein